MIRVFVDASVFFAASYSKTGSSRRLFLEALRGQIGLVISEHILDETERNLADKAPGALPAFHTLIELMGLELVEKPTLEELETVASYVHVKDAPVVAAALKATADYLVTWDRKHFLDDPQVAQKSGLSIITPDRLIALIQEQRENQQ